MKKLFVSCPMNGRTEENIRNSMEHMHRIAEAFFDQKLEIIPTYIEDAPPENINSKIWYLGKSIELMANADYFIGVRYSDAFFGGVFESEIARKYGIPCFEVDIEMMPDALKIENEYWKSVTPEAPHAD
jgi:hypothetical protein